MVFVNEPAAQAIKIRQELLDTYALGIHNLLATQHCGRKLGFVNGQGFGLQWQFIAPDSAGAHLGALHHCSEYSVQSSCQQFCMKISYCKQVTVAVTSYYQLNLKRGSSVLKYTKWNQNIALLEDGCHVEVQQYVQEMGQGERAAERLKMASKAVLSR